MNKLMEEQVQRNAERQRQLIESMKREDPTLDPELLRRYLDLKSSPPMVVGDDSPAHQEIAAQRTGELFRRGAALGDLMGQLSYQWRPEEGRAPLVVDQAKAYSAFAANFERELLPLSPSGEVETQRLDFLRFDDIALGLPALLEMICDRGGDEIVFTLEEYDDP